MADEPKVESKAEPSEVDTLKEQIASLTNKNTEYERLLLDPAYLEFLAGPGSSTATQPRTTTKAVPREEEADVDQMSNKELVEYILTTLRGEVRQQVEPVKQANVMAEMQRQVKDAAAKFGDFWEFKDDMIAYARQHPTATAEDAYHVCKGRAGGKPRGKPPVRSETPTGGARTVKKPVEGFDAKFLEAWQAAGFEKKE